MWTFSVVHISTAFVCRIRDLHLLVHSNEIKMCKYKATTLKLAKFLQIYITIAKNRIWWAIFRQHRAVTHWNVATLLPTLVSSWKSSNVFGNTVWKPTLHAAFGSLSTALSNCWWMKVLSLLQNFKASPVYATEIIFSDHSWRLPKYLIYLIFQLMGDVLIFLILFCLNCLKRQQNHFSRKTRGVSSKADGNIFPFQ